MSNNAAAGPSNHLSPVHNVHSHVSPVHNVNSAVQATSESRSTTPQPKRPSPTAPFHPPADTSTYRDLLLFEERLKLNAEMLRRRKRRYSGECAELVRLGWAGARSPAGGGLPERAVRRPAHTGYRGMSAVCSSGVCSSRHWPCWSEPPGDDDDAGDRVTGRSHLPPAVPSTTREHTADTTSLSLLLHGRPQRHGLPPRRDATRCEWCGLRGADPGAGLLAGQTSHR